MLNFGFVKSHEVLCYLESSSSGTCALHLGFQLYFFSSSGCDDFVAVSVLGGPVNHCPVVISLVSLDLGG